MVLLNKWGTHAVSVFAWGEACDRSSGLRLVQLAHDDRGIAVGLKFPRSLPRQKADKHNERRGDPFGYALSLRRPLGISVPCHPATHWPSMHSDGGRLDFCPNRKLRIFIRRLFQANPSLFRPPHLASRVWLRRAASPHAARGREIRSWRGSV